MEPVDEIQPLDERLYDDLEDYEIPESDYPEQLQIPMDLGREDEDS